MNTLLKLNKHRKQKMSADKKVQAAENSLEFGLTKTERAKAASDSKKSISHLDKNKRDG